MAFSAHGVTHRPTVTGTRGMVACAHPLAALSGARMLLEGGNAFDAAVAVAAALNVVEPYMSGIAGVGYAIVYDAKNDHRRVLDYWWTNARIKRVPSCLIAQRIKMLGRVRV